MLNIGGPFQEQLHNGLVAKGAGPSEGTIWGGFSRGIDVSIVV